MLHLATHGFYLSNLPGQATDLGTEEPLLFSGLALAGANQGLSGFFDENGDDGLLYSLEVVDMNLQGTELVSLSACSTGNGVVDYSEGVYGLVRAFRTAGANSVLMTLYNVGDESSKKFMVRFYETWLSQKKDGMTPAEAMDKTRLDFIRKGYPPQAWEPYVLVGF